MAFKIKSLTVCLLVAVLTGVLLIGCSAKLNPTTPEAFTDVMVGKGYATLDMTKEFSPDKIKSLTLAIKSTYRFEFYVMPSRVQAIDSYNAFYDALPEGGDKEGDTVLMDKKTSDYSVYRKLTKDEYIYVARIGDTLLSVAAPADAKDEIDACFVALGYHFE